MDRSTVGQTAGGSSPPRRRTLHAEEVGFEPTVSFPTHDFQSCRFGRSRTPPELPVRSSREAIVSRCIVRCSVRRPGPAQRAPVNRVRAGRQQLSAGPVVCRSKPGRRTEHRHRTGHVTAPWRRRARTAPTRRPRPSVPPVGCGRGRRRRQGSRSLPVSVPSLPPAALRRGARTGAREPGPAKRGARRSGRAMPTSSAVRVARARPRRPASWPRR